MLPQIGQQINWTTKARQNFMSLSETQKKMANICMLILLKIFADIGGVFPMFLNGVEKVLN